MTDDLTVHVVAGRKRFHVGSCRLLTGKASEQLTLIEAREETFTPCSLCVEVRVAALNVR